MSHLVARLLLSMLVFPLGALVYLVTLIVYDRMFGTRATFGARDEWIAAGVVCWAFIGVYWWLLWRRSVRWTAERAWLTIAAMFGAVLAGTVFGWLVWIAVHQRDFTAFVGTTSPILLWLVATCILWRESPTERADRLSASGRNAVVCPTCGYNLTGLTEPRCPECGSRFTLDQLLASQPHRVAAELVE
jgi:hypothetical protein